MKRLSELLNDRDLGDSARFIEKGQIFWYSRPFKDIEPRHLSDDCTSLVCNKFCWKSPGNGTVIIEAWGAGGTASPACNNEMSLGGNSGAYSRKHIRVNSSSYIIGHCLPYAPICSSYLGACGAPYLIERSPATELEYFGMIETGCMCAEGGYGGMRQCANGCAWRCWSYGSCTEIGTFCNSPCRIPADCTLSTCWGMVCNIKTAGTVIGEVTLAQAYGGDINKQGTYSKVLIWCNQTNSSRCYMEYFHAYAPGHFTNYGEQVDDISYGNYVATRRTDSHPSGSMASEQDTVSNFQGTKLFTHQPTGQQWWGRHMCGNYICKCHPTGGCIVIGPPGAGGTGMLPCASFISYTNGGGPGAVKIRYIKE